MALSATAIGKIGPKDKLQPIANERGFIAYCRYKGLEAANCHD